MPTVLDIEVREGAPAVLHADPAGDAAGWAAAHREPVRAAVTDHGALVARGLDLHDRAAVAVVTRALAGGAPMTETEAFAPRTAHPEGVYSATPWPAHEAMCLHHELSYTRPMPGLMMFACLTPATSGGATPVADAAAVLADLPAHLVARVEREGWCLDRTYNDEIGAPWAAAFGTDDPARVEAYCRETGIELAWQPDGGLRTRQRRPGVIRHPRTGARCWVNQLAFLSEWTIDPEVREFLVEVYGEESLPFTTRFGDGSPVGEDVVATINDVYTAHTRRAPWQAGDLMLVDNLSTAHGRESYEGPREVLAALAEPTAPTEG